MRSTGSTSRKRNRVESEVAVEADVPVVGGFHLGVADLLVNPPDLGKVAVEATASFLNLVLDLRVAVDLEKGDPGVHQETKEVHRTRTTTAMLIISITVTKCRTVFNKVPETLAGGDNSELNVVCSLHH